MCEAEKHRFVIDSQPAGQLIDHLAAASRGLLRRAKAVAWVPGDATSISKLQLVSIRRLTISIAIASSRLQPNEIGRGITLLSRFC